jgi:hypothetical protein
MRFPKTLTFSCLLVVGAAVGYSQTAEQQEKALRTLRQFIAEKEAAPAAPRAQTPPPVAQPAPATEDKVKAAQQTLENLRGSGQTGQVSPSSLPEDKERKARAALDELRRSGARPAAPLTATTSPLTDTQEQKARTALSQVYTGAAPGSTLPADAESRARAALEQLRNQQPAVAAVPAPAQAPVAPAAAAPARPAVVATPAAAAAQPAAAPASLTVVEPAPTPAPAATPVALTKKDKLQEILELYIADQITPREYHDRRAQILAGN